MNDVHPVFAGVLDAIAAAPSVLRAARMKAYIHALDWHDWGFQYSDDHKVWMRGSAERAEILKLQRELDPTFEVWNQHAPIGDRFSSSPAEPEDPVIAQRVREMM